MAGYDAPLTAGLEYQNREFWMAEILKAFPERAADPNLIYGNVELEYRRLVNEGLVFAGQPDLSQLATKQELASFAAKTELTPLATKTELTTGLSSKANTSHTHTAVNISDSTATGRSLLVAASATAAKTTLSLENVNNTTDANKPISIATAAEFTARNPVRTQLALTNGFGHYNAGDWSGIWITIAGKHVVINGALAKATWAANELVANLAVGSRPPVKVRGENCELGINGNLTVGTAGSAAGTLSINYYLA